jgi:hypothetical protein
MKWQCLLFCYRYVTLLSLHFWECCAHYVSCKPSASWRNKFRDLWFKVVLYLSLMSIFCLLSCPCVLFQFCKFYASILFLFRWLYLFRLCSVVTETVFDSWVWGPHCLLSNWYRGALTPGREADLVPRSRILGAIPPLSQYAFMAWCLFKHRIGWRGAVHI